MLRSSVGSAWRDSAKLTGSCVCAIATRQPSATSLASAGRIVIIPGIARSVESCSIGWCVGPSSPTPMLSCVKM